MVLTSESEYESKIDSEVSDWGGGGYDSDSSAVDSDAEEEQDIDDVVIKEEDFVFRPDIVPKEVRMTSNFLTKQELAQVISSRAAQLENGAQAFVKTIHDKAVDIATVELRDGRLPYIIKRACPHGVEYWNVREMNYNPEHLNRDDKLAYRSTH
tara:strand:- start:304 stop:765 length:462 start_codon:yes stop_codon:yes gene_type:complete